MRIDGRDPASGEVVRLEIEGGRIASIGPGPAGVRAWLAPGLVDVQVNGFGGHDLNAPPLRPETVAALTVRLAQDGVTTFLPTLITASERSLVAGLAAIAAARAADAAVAHAIPGVHVEGPHIAPEDGPRGAHPAAHVRPPDIAEFDRWQAACGGLVSMVTLSPHWPGVEAYIAALAGRGVHVALGHSAATPEQVRAAAAAGAVLSTHLGNGAAAMLPRHPNLIWAQLAEDRLTAGFIADGHHLPGDALTAMLRAKGLGRALLVSDATALGGMAPGRYTQLIGGEVELRADGRLGTVGTPYLAGAALPLLAGVGNAMRLAGLSLAEALGLATAAPGRFAGGRGVLAVGGPADVIRFDWAAGDVGLRLTDVLTQGRAVEGVRA